MTALTAILTHWICCRMERANSAGDQPDAHTQFLAGGTPNWSFVTGSLEHTTLCTYLLEMKTGSKRFRATIDRLFLAGNLSIYLSFMFYTGAVLLKSILDLNLSVLAIATPLALAGQAVFVFGKAA